LHLVGQEAVLPMQHMFTNQEALLCNIIPFFLGSNAFTLSGRVYCCQLSRITSTMGLSRLCICVLISLRCRDSLACMQDPVIHNMRNHAFCRNIRGKLEGPKLAAHTRVQMPGLTPLVALCNRSSICLLTTSDQA